MKSDSVFPDISELDRASGWMNLRRSVDLYGVVGAARPGSFELTCHRLGALRDQDGDGVLRAPNDLPVGCVDYETGVVTVLPDHVLDAIQNWTTQPAETTHQLNRDQTVAVATDVFWNEDMATAPRGTKCQLLGAGGVAHYGNYHGDPFWVGWAPLPKRREKPTSSTRP